MLTAAQILELVKGGYNPSIISYIYAPKISCIDITQ